MTIYLAGPMTGLPDFNFPAFDSAASLLESEGHIVHNPAKMDRDVGFDSSQATVSKEFLRDAFRRDLAAVCESDAIALLPGWEQSPGARIEWMLAVHLGLDVIYLSEWLTSANER